MKKKDDDNTIIFLLLGAGLLFLLLRKKPTPPPQIEQILKDAFNNLQFETGKSIIKDESKPSLDILAEVLISKNWQLKLIGHTDNVGTDADNLILSKNRAEAVKNYLVSKGVNIGNITTEGKGETMPLVSNETEQGREKNRRVEFIIIK